MTIPQTANDVLSDHVTLEVECIDRMYLNLYVPLLQTSGGINFYWTEMRGFKFASSALMKPMTQEFVARIEEFASREHIDIISFEKGQRKEDVAAEYLARFPLEEGVLFIGKAQEKTKVFRTERRRNPETGATYAWLTRSTAMVNQYYFYCVDRDFGPFFVKLGSYFPYNGKICINGHEYAKRQLDRLGIAYEALENGFLSCADPGRLRKICDSLSDRKIEALSRKWLRRLPHPFSRRDYSHGIRHEVSILQAEFALTQVFDRPLSGRVFFEQVIRENIDLGRPDHVQLIFGRRVCKNTPSRFRTRVITHGVIPSIHVDYKYSRIKQYFKEGRALRTETVINNTYDFDIGRMVKNLSALRKVGFTANRRLLCVQRISHDCWIGEDNFNRVTRPTKVDDQRVPALRFGEPRAVALLSALLHFRLLPRGFANADLRDFLTPLLDRPISPGMMSYDLRRLRLHGLIERIPRSRRYRLTEFGARAATFLSRTHSRILRPGASYFNADVPNQHRSIAAALDAVDRAVDTIWAKGIDAA